MAKKRKKKEGKPQEPRDNMEDRQTIIAQRDLLISAWRARDELYKNLFGEPTSISPANYAPPPPISWSLDTAGSQAADMATVGLEEQRLAIFAYAPDPLRAYWTYITAGLSSPWVQNEPDEVSGFGCELMI